MTGHFDRLFLCFLAVFTLIGEGVRVPFKPFLPSPSFLLLLYIFKYFRGFFLILTGRLSHYAIHWGISDLHLALKCHRLASFDFQGSLAQLDGLRCWR